MKKEKPPSLKVAWFKFAKAVSRERALRDEAEKMFDRAHVARGRESVPTVGTAEMYAVADILAAKSDLLRAVSERRFMRTVITTLGAGAQISWSLNGVTINGVPYRYDEPV